jgi:hypothetical protein
VATMNIRDTAHEFRIELVGRFAGSLVNEVFLAWESALGQNLSRRISVDITELEGYDQSGCNMLREIYRHGTVMLARSALSLVFLSEISSPPRLGPALVRKPSHETASRSSSDKRSSDRQLSIIPMHRTAASGE